MNIVIFDKQGITRLGIEALVNQKYPTSNIVTVGDKVELISMLTSFPSGIVIIDYTLSDLNSVDALMNISARFHDVRWLILSEDLSVQFVKRVLTNDMFSIVLKTADLAEIEAAIASANNHKAYLCSHLANMIAMAEVNNEGNKDILTITEKEILKEMALGKTAKEIAVVRNVSVHTLITHRKNIYRKLEVNNAQEASRYALRAGIIDAADYFI